MRQRNLCAVREDSSLFEDYAERLSTAVFNLVHDGGDLISVLTQLGVKDSLKFVSSGGIAVPNGLPPPDVAFPALVIFEGGPGGRGFVPQLGDGPRLGKEPPNYPSLPFRDWWENQFIYQEKAMIGLKIYPSWTE